MVQALLRIEKRANSVDPDNEPLHLDLFSLQTQLYIYFFWGGWGGTLYVTNCSQKAPVVSE